MKIKVEIKKHCWSWFPSEFNTLRIAVAEFCFSWSRAKLDLCYCITSNCTLPCTYCLSYGKYSIPYDTQSDTDSAISPCVAVAAARVPPGSRSSCTGRNRSSLGRRGSNRSSCSGIKISGTCKRSELSVSRR
jgi:hypothetical protein